MRKVEIQFTRPKSKWKFISRAIQLWEGTRYSHVRLFWHTGSGEPIIYEASGGMVRVVGQDAARSCPVEIVHSYDFYLDKGQKHKLIGLLRYAGVSYGFTQILGIAVASVFKLKKNPLAMDKQQVCSELVAHFLTDVLDYKIPSRQFDLIGPKGIHKLVKAIPRRRVGLQLLD